MSSDKIDLSKFDIFEVHIDVALNWKIRFKIQSILLIHILTNSNPHFVHTFFTNPTQPNSNQVGVTRFLVRDAPNYMIHAKKQCHTTQTPPALRPHPPTVGKHVVSLAKKQTPLLGDRLIFVRVV